MRLCWAGREAIQPISPAGGEGSSHTSSMGFLLIDACLVDVT